MDCKTTTVAAAGYCAVCGRACYNCELCLKVKGGVCAPCARAALAKKGVAL
jgi:hypothetical protein